MIENDDFKEDIVIDEKEAKKQFLDELRNKNLEETKQLEIIKLEDDQENESNANAGKEENAIESINNNKGNNKKIDTSASKKSFKAALIDTALCGVMSVIGVYLFDGILRPFGYYVVDFKGIYIIALLIVLILYPTIMQGLKNGKTFGQKFSNI